MALHLIAGQVEGRALFATAIAFTLFVFVATPFTDAVIVSSIDDRMRRSEETYVRVGVCALCADEA